MIFFSGNLENLLNLMYPALLPRMNLGRTTEAERAKACLQVLIDNAESLSIGIVADRLGLLLFSEIRCREDTDKIYTLRDCDLKFVPPSLSYSQSGKGNLVWISDSTCLLHTPDGKHTIPVDAVDEIERRVTERSIAAG
jgi:hypothetical protein